MADAVVRDKKQRMHYGLDKKMVVQRDDHRNHFIVKSSSSPENGRDLM